METISDTTHVVVQGKSMYDTLIAPELYIDSIKVYRELENLLQFSNRLEYKNEIRFATYFFLVDSAGKMQKASRDERIHASKDIKTDVEKAMYFVLANLAHWKPGFVKGSPSKRVSFSIEVVFSFYRDRIEFTVMGDQSYCYLRKAYAPNYSKVY